MNANNPQPTLVEIAAAWSVHLFTASGVLWGLLAVIATIDERWIAAIGWMALATCVDSFDGMLARRFRVKELANGIDGALLDNIIDYFTYVLVPAIFLYQAQLLPSRLAILCMALMAFSSAYQFSQQNAKTDDHYFTGFPSYWNVTVFYLFVLNLGSTVNLIIIALFALLVFIPIKYVYPSRTPFGHRLTMALSLIWGITIVIIIFRYPQQSPSLVWGSFSYIIYYIVLSLYLTFQHKQKPQPNAQL